MFGQDEFIHVSEIHFGDELQTILSIILQSNTNSQIQFLRHVECLKDHWVQLLPGNQHRWSSNFSTHKNRGRFRVISQDYQLSFLFWKHIRSFAHLANRITSALSLLKLMLSPRTNGGTMEIHFDGIYAGNIYVSSNNHRFYSVELFSCFFLDLPHCIGQLLLGDLINSYLYWNYWLWFLPDSSMWFP